MHRLIDNIPRSSSGAGATETAKSKEQSQSLPPPHPIPFSYPPVISPQTSLAHRGDGVSLHYQPPSQQKSFLYWGCCEIREQLDKFYTRSSLVGYCSLHTQSLGFLVQERANFLFGSPYIEAAEDRRDEDSSNSEAWHPEDPWIHSFLPRKGTGLGYSSKRRRTWLSVFPSLSVAFPGDACLPCWLCQPAQCQLDCCMRASQEQAGYSGVKWISPCWFTLPWLNSPFLQSLLSTCVC